DTPVRAGGCDPRAVGAYVDADGRVHPRAVGRTLVEAEQHLAGPNAPDPDSPGGARARHESPAVRRERDACKPLRSALRARQRERLAAPGLGDVPNSRVARKLTPAYESRPVSAERDAADGVAVAAEPEQLTQLAVGDIPDLREAV